MGDMTQKELKDKLLVLDIQDEEKVKSVVCALIGHSAIQTSCFSYYYCGRCGDQVGDRLGSVYDPSDVVIIGHNCDICHSNYKKLGWRDKFMVPNPFTKKKGD